MQNSGKWVVRIIAAILVLSLIAGFAVMAFAEEEASASYASLQEALDNDASYYQLLADVDEVTINNNILLDLNGHKAANMTVAEGVTLQLLDSANDQYDAAACGSFSGTVNGAVEQVVKHDAKKYLVIENEGVYSAHRFYAGIDRVSLVPGKAALGYKAIFKADSVIDAMVSEYGYAMWVNNFVARTFTKSGPIEKSELTLRVQNILQEGNAALSQLGATATISGQATISFNVNGQIVTEKGAEHDTTMRAAVEAVNTALGQNRSAYSKTQIQSVRDLIEKFDSYMNTWEQEYIFTEDKFAAIENVSTTYGENLSLGQVFTAVEGMTIGENVTATVNGEAIPADANWADTELKLGAGEHVITITDNDRCWTATNVVTVAKADPSYEIPTGLTATYGDDLSSVELPSNFAWESTGTVGNAGENKFAVTYTPADTANYNVVAGIEVTVAVAKAESSVTAPTANALTYTGEAQELITAGTATGGKLVYKVGEDEYSETIPTAINAGTYTVYYMVVGDENHNDSEAGTVEVTIAKAESSVTAPTANVLTYTGAAQELITAGTATGGKLVYKVGEDEYSETIPTATNAGEYTVYYMVQENENYNGVAEQSITVTIAKAASSVTAPTANELTYTGNEQALITAGTATGGKLVYKLGDGEYSETIPTATNAGTYTVYYKVEATDNYNGIAEQFITVTIAKAESTCTAPTANVLTYNDKAQALVTAGTATGGKLVYKVGEDEYSETIPTATNAGTYTVYYKVEENGNYNGIGEKSLTVTIAQAEPEYTVPTGLTATEGDALSTITLEGGFAWKNADEIVSLDKAEYDATFTPEDTDNYNIVDVKIPVAVSEKVKTPVDKFAVALYEGEPAFLYRVGNANAVKLGSLFKALDGVEIGNVSVTITKVAGDAAGTYNANSTWTNGTIQFSGTGVVEVTISDDAYANEVSIKLEVVTAKNATTATSATANNVVLLNDISGTFTVSNGYTFYGNGFTVKLPTTHVKNTGNGFTGYINIGAAQDDGIANGGHLDNVRIEGPVYPEMYIYRDQAKITDSSDPDYGDGYNMRYFVNSVIVYGGNVTISNCYISGSRTALCLRGGNNVVIENTTLSGGAYANMQICAGSNVTLRNLTTVQVDETDSYGKGKTAHGMGIAVDSSVVDIYIEGSLKQHNWLNQTQWNSIVPTSYQSYFPKFFTDSSFEKYWHYVDGGTDPYVNMGLIFACNWDTAKIHDNRTTVDYGTTNATIAGVAGGVYTKLNTIGGNAITQADIEGPVYAPTGYNPVAPVLNFDNTVNHDEDDANDTNDTYCVYTESAGTLSIGVSGSSKTLDLSGVTVTKNGAVLDRIIYLNGTQISGNSVTINAADGAKQTLVIKATSNDAGYDVNGNPIEGSIEYSWTVNVEMAVLAFPAPVWNMGGDYEFDKTNCYYAYYSTSQGYGEAVPIYEGIKVDYYNKNGQLVNLDLSGTTTHPTGSANSNSNAFTYTLADGSTLTMKFSSGWKSGATTHQFTTYSNKVYIYPQSLDNDNYVRAKTTNQDFDVKITYNFTDPNGQSTGDQVMRWYNAMASNGSVSTVQWKTFDSVNGKKASICVTPDTLVTMADGTQKEIQNVTYDDTLLVWDFYEGKYVEAPATVLVNHGYDNYEIIKLIFEDGTTVKLVGEHGLYCKEENKFVYINSNNVADYVGYHFVQQDNNGYAQVKLIDYEVYTEYTESYSLLSSVHANAFIEGLLSITPQVVNPYFFPSFDVDENLTYDREAMDKDVAQYGLYTYEEFAEYLTYDEFISMNIAITKVAVGKGLLTVEEIIETIQLAKLLG